MIRNQPCDAATFGIDIGKNILHVVGVDVTGQPIQRIKLRRDTLLQFFEHAKPAVAGMEACPGSQWLARRIRACGHTVRIIPAQFVKPYLKSNRNDALDAEAIAEAVMRPTMSETECRPYILMRLSCEAHSTTNARYAIGHAKISIQRMRKMS